MVALPVADPRTSDKTLPNKGPNGAKSNALNPASNSKLDCSPTKFMFPFKKKRSSPSFEMEEVTLN